MSNDANNAEALKMAEEYANQNVWLPPNWSIDDHKRAVTETWLAGYNAKQAEKLAGEIQLVEFYHKGKDPQQLVSLVELVKLQTIIGSQATEIESWKMLHESNELCISNQHKEHKLIMESVERQRQLNDSQAAELEDLRRTEKVYHMNREWIEDAKVEIAKLKLQSDKLAKAEGLLTEIDKIASRQQNNPAASDLRRIMHRFCELIEKYRKGER